MKKIFLFIAIFCLTLILSVSLLGCFPLSSQNKIKILDEQLFYANNYSAVKLTVKVENTSNTTFDVSFDASLYIGNTVWDSAPSNVITLTPGDAGYLTCVFSASSWLTIDDYTYKITKWKYF
ncbi:MAG: hypothetical protein J6A99_01415 [Clostridia bacterium]|nr:hypothetical protein [Clostridia bacterium]